jgi:gliding motility-associated-like protein
MKFWHLSIFASIVLFLLLSAITAGAQCSFTLEAKIVQHSECPASGIIQVNLSGDDVDLNMIQISMTGSNGLTNLTSTTNNQQFSALHGDEYTITANAVCKNAGATVTKTTKVTIQSNHNEIGASISGTGNAIQCGSAGTVSFGILEGKPPYTVKIVSAPAEYSGEKTAVSSSGTVTIRELPAGHYDFTVTDDCSFYEIPLSADVELAPQSFPSDPFSGYIDCNNVVISASYPMAIYEVNFSVNGIDLGWRQFDGSDSWKKTTLPYTIKEMRDNDYAIDIKLRLKNCPDIEQIVDKISVIAPEISYSREVNCGNHTLTFYPLYVCYPYNWEIRSESGVLIDSEKGIENNSNQIINLESNKNYILKITDSEGTTLSRDINNVTKTINLDSRFVCKNYILSFYPRYICYPYDWEISEKESGVLIDSETGIENNSEQIINLESNKIYVLKITDGEGTELSRNINTTNTINPESLYIYSSSYNYCLPDTFSSCHSINRYDIISAGTRIRQVSGPTTAVHTDVTLKKNISYYYPFSVNYENREYVRIEEGKYEFEITDTCGNSFIKTLNHRNLELRDFGYVTKEDCDGLHVFPTGNFYYKGTNSLYSNSYIYYQMIKTPEGVSKSSFSANSTNPVDKTGNYFLLYKSGRYVFQISTGSCPTDSIEINYEHNNFSLNHSVYTCTAGGKPHFYLRARYGKPPYTYELLENEIFVGSNNTGDFVYGSIDKSYSVRVTDMCNKSFITKLQVIDVFYDAIISGTGKVCLGDTIFLGCLNLGASVFSWTGPAGFLSSVQNTFIPDAAPTNGGTYTVSLQPFGCELPISQNFNVEIYAPPPAPSGFDTVQLCMNEVYEDLSSGINSLPNHSLVWYAGDEIMECPLPEINTATTHEETYYVAQKIDGLGCVGDKHKITVIINPLPSTDISFNPIEICPGSAPFIEIQNSVTGYTYDIYSDPEGTNKIAEIAGTGSDISKTLPGAINNNDTIYYIKVKSDKCEAPDLVPVNVPKKKLFIAPDTLAPYSFDQPYEFQLNSNAAGAVYSYSGSLPEGMSFSNSGLFSGTVSNLGYKQEDLLTVTVTDTDGCFVSKTYILSICEYLPDVPETEIYYCKNATATPLQASSPNALPLQWYEGSNKQNEAPVPNTSIPGEQIFYVAQINKTMDCEGEKAKITVTIIDDPAIDFVATADEVCYGYSASITLDNIIENHIYNIYSDIDLTNKVASVTGESSKTVTLKDVPETDKTYYILVTDNKGCSSPNPTEIDIVVKKLFIDPESLPSFRQNVEYDQNLTTNAGFPEFRLIEGQLPYGLTLSSTGHIYGIAPTGGHDNFDFTVEVMDSEECTTARNYTLTGDFFVPKAFSPNNDGINDFFMKGYRVIIFDRMGIPVFEGNDGWDGTYNGKVVSQDTYFYKLFYTENGETKIKTGYVGTIGIIRN